MDGAADNDTGAGLPRGAVVAPLDDVIDPDTFTPRLVTLLANAITARESHALRQTFGLGTNEWRILSALARRPGSTGSELATILYVNKSIVSRALRQLERRQLIVVPVGQLRSRSLFLTRQGAEMYQQMRPVSAIGQDIILAGLDPHQITEFNAQLTRMLEALRSADRTVEGL